jgi:hypothetical protein
MESKAANTQQNKTTQHNTTHKNIHVTQNDTPRPNKTQHTHTQTINDALHTTNTIQYNTIQKSKATPVTGRGGL